MTANPGTDTCFLLWRNETVGVVHHIVQDAEGFGKGQLELTGDIHPRVAKFWGYIHHMKHYTELDTTETPSPPCPGFILERWSIEFVDGTSLQIHLPLPDKTFRTIAWARRH